MKTTILLLCSTLLLTHSYAQNKCKQQLKEAVQLFETGHLKEVQPKLEQCLKNGFNKQERVDALKLLTKTCLFLEDPQKAERFFLKLIRLDPEHFFDPASEPSELLYLYRSYRTEPIMTLGIKAGMNLTDVEILQHFGLDNTTAAHPSYKSETGFQLALQVEVPLFKNADLLLEPTYMQRGYQYSQKLRTSTGNLNFAELKFTEKQNWLSLPVLFRYTFGKQKLQPFAYLGLEAQLLLQSTIQNPMRITDPTADIAPDVVGSDIDATDLRKRLNYALTAGLGIKYKIGINYLLLDIRYSRSMLNSTQADKRYSQNELSFRYGYVDHDIRLSNLSISLGYTRAIFKHKKRKKKIKKQ